MKLQLSSKDWQLLSAYLDGQLSPRERSQVEQRLRTQPDYREGLQTLRKNQAMLRSLPRRPVPRNFTLTPEMVAAPRRSFLPPMAPVLRFSSALATIFLVLTLALQQLPRLSPAMKSAPQGAEPDVTMMESVPEEPAAGEPEFSTMRSEADEGPPVVYWGGPPNVPYANGLGGMGGGGDGGGLVNQPPYVYIPLAPIEPAPPVEGGEPAPPGEEERSAIARAPEIEGTGPILGVPPVEKSGELLKPLEQPADNMLVETYGLQAGPENRLLIVQIGLGLLALITGVAAFIVRRKTTS